MSNNDLIKLFTDAPKPILERFLALSQSALTERQAIHQLIQREKMDEARKAESNFNEKIASFKQLCVKSGFECPDFTIDDLANRHSV